MDPLSPQRDGAAWVANSATLKPGAPVGLVIKEET